MDRFFVWVVKLAIWLGCVGLLKPATLFMAYAAYEASYEDAFELWEI